MDTTHLFSMALGLVPPWYVAGVEFEPASDEISRGHLGLDLAFPPGSTLPCPECGQLCKVHDTRQRQWRHLDFFQHECLLTAHCPRVKCKEHGVLSVKLPWEGTGTGFTALFEAFAVELCRHMAVAAAARMLRIGDTTLWGILRRHVSAASARADLSKVRVVGVDDRSSKKGYNYVTIFAELANNPERRRVIFATPGRDSSVFEAFVGHLESHGGQASQVKEVAMDMAKGYVKGATDELPKAKITFDRFHVMKLANEAVDEIRREESKMNTLLKKTRYAWLKKPSKLTTKQRKIVNDPTLLHTATGRAYQLKETLSDFFNGPPDLARDELKRITEQMCASGIASMIRLGKTLTANARHVLRYFKSQITTGYLEGINSLIQAAKAKARGYRSNENLITMIYLIAGKLKLDTQPFSTH